MKQTPGLKAAVDTYLETGEEVTEAYPRSAHVAEVAGQPGQYKNNPG